MIVANLIPYKGHADLIDALALAAPRLGLNWRLVIVGRDAGIGAELKRRAGAAGIDDSLLWLGEQPSADALFAAADIAVLASHEEGFSNALIEAMGRRLPAIATTVGGNADAIADGVSGLLVPPRAPAELAAAILRLASDAELRTRLGDAARRRVEREFSLEAAALRHANLYAGLRAGIRAPVERLIELGAPAGP
jgi:glycosyltransferase involved in cell wall biosynthesis